MSPTKPTSDHQNIEGVNCISGESMGTGNDNLFWHYRNESLTIRIGKTRIFWKGYVTTEIHMEDFTQSLLGKLFGTRTKMDDWKLLGEGNRSEDQTRIMENMFLDGVSNPFGGNTDYYKEIIANKAAEKNNAEFYIAIGKAMKTPRKPTWSDLELFVLKAWRRIIIDGQEFPGLREWSPISATSLLQFLKVMPTGEVEFYRKTRQRLFLVPASISVENFQISEDGKVAEITFLDGRRFQLVVGQKKI